MRTVSKIATITEEIPLRLADLHIPPGWRLEDWLAHEKDRITRAYPVIKETDTEVSYDIRDMIQIADRIEKEWEEKRHLVRVILREEMGYAKRALTPDGKPVAERRMYSVPGYIVDDYQVDAIFRL